MKDLGVLLPLFLTGCMAANISAQMRRTQPPDGNIQTRCEHVDMRNTTQMEVVMKKYDGWHLLYISEYTTENRFGTDGVVCFEHVTKQ